MSSLFNLDNLCRDLEDGAYHCPSCNAPFTRRSNLRRHFVIHTRNMPFKCNSCESRFSRSDELQYHYLSCLEVPWQDTTNPSLLSMARDSSLDVMTSLQTTMDTPCPAQDSVSISPLLSSGQDADQVFADFLSCLSSPTTDVIEEFQTSYGQFGALSGMLDSTNKNSPSNPSTTSHQISTTRTRLYPRRASTQPYTALNRRKKSKDKPVYTRRQVDDMLKAVGSCFAGTMEEVLKRVDPNVKNGEKTPNPMNDTLMVESPNHELRKLLGDTLPRLFNGLQNFLDERNKVD